MEEIISYGDYDHLRCEYSIDPYIPATMYDRNGDPGSPEEGGDIYDLFIFNEDNDDITDDFTNEEIINIKERIYERRY